MAKIRVVIRNMDDVIEFQILRWKRQFPDAAEPEEWSDNEITPDEHFEAREEISEADEQVILADDRRHWAGTAADGQGTMVRRGTYDKGYGANHDAEFVKRAAADHKSHYDAELMKTLEELEKEYGDEYDIVYEDKYKELIEKYHKKNNDLL